MYKLTKIQIFNVIYNFQSTKRPGGYMENKRDTQS